MSTDLTIYDPYLAAEEDDDLSDITPGIGRIKANSQSGRFKKEDEDIGSELMVVVLAAPQGHTAWGPDPEASPPKPFFRELTQLEIPSGKPFCRNRDLKRRQPELSDDLSDSQKDGLKKLGWTGECKGCPFFQGDPETKQRVCSPDRDLLVMVSGDDMPHRMSIKGHSLMNWYNFVRKSLKSRGKSYQTFVKKIKLAFQEVKEGKKTFYPVTFADAGWVPVEKLEDLAALRDAFFEYDAEPAEEEPATVSTTTSTAVEDEAPPHSDEDEPILPGTEEAFNPNTRKTGYF